MCLCSARVENWGAFFGSLPKETVFCRARVFGAGLQILGQRYYWFVSESLNHCYKRAVSLRVGQFSRHLIDLADVSDSSISTECVPAITAICACGVAIFPDVAIKTAARFAQRA